MPDSDPQAQLATLRQQFAEQEQRIAQQRDMIEELHTQIHNMIHPGMIAQGHGLCHSHMQEETPLATLHRVWRLVAPGDRLCFLTEMLTPNERRALALGLEEDLDAPS